MVEKIAELDLELSEGDITQKGYEKKKTKLLAPFLRENQVPSKTEEQKNGVKAKPRQTNGSSHQPPSSSSATPSAPPAPQADSSQASGASGMSDSSGRNKYT